MNILKGNIIEKIRRRVNHYQGKHLMLSRVACLGNDVHRILYKDKELVNQQKVRADMFLDWAQNGKRPVSEAVKAHLKRQDILDLIEQQQALPWLSTKRSSDLILMDSFSELTDQKFVHKKEGWSFGCNFSDIEHTDEFRDNFDCHGLIEVEELERLYFDFFRFVNKHYRNKDILFLHFPTALDSRAKFKERGSAIYNAIENMCKVYPNIRSISIDESLVLPHEDDDFPYHYGKPTYQHFAKQITGVATAANF